MYSESVSCRVQRDNVVVHRDNEEVHKDNVVVHRDNEEVHRDNVVG